MDELKRYCELELDPYSPAKFRDPNGWNSVEYEGWPCVNDECLINHKDTEHGGDLFSVATYQGDHKFLLWNKAKVAKDVIAWKRVDLWG